MFIRLVLYCKISMIRIPMISGFQTNVRFLRQRAQHVRDQSVLFPVKWLTHDPTSHEYTDHPPRSRSVRTKSSAQLPHQWPCDGSRGIRFIYRPPPSFIQLERLKMTTSIQDTSTSNRTTLQQMSLTYWLVKSLLSVD